MLCEEDYRWTKNKELENNTTNSIKTNSNYIYQN